MTSWIRRTSERTPLQKLPRIPHLQAVARRDEATLGEEAGRRAVWSGCQRELEALPLPDGPDYVGVDGGFVRDRAGSWFEVIAGKSIPGFRRDAPENDRLQLEVTLPH